MHLHKIALTYHMDMWVTIRACHAVLGSAQLFFEGDTMFHRISPGAKSDDARCDRGH